MPGPRLPARFGYVRSPQALQDSRRPPPSDICGKSIKKAGH
jgi:hypothetical protein